MQTGAARNLAIKQAPMAVPWTPEAAARRDVELARLLAQQDRATQRVAIRLVAARVSAHRSDRTHHTSHTTAQMPAAERQPAAAAGADDADGGATAQVSDAAQPRRRRRKSEARRRKDADRLEEKWEQRFDRLAQLACGAGVPAEDVQAIRKKEWRAA